MTAFCPAHKALWLHKVCESNYRKLEDLIPNLTRMAEHCTARVSGKPALHLRVLERSRYTLTLELTHDFPWSFEVRNEPAVRIQVSLDAKTAEVLSDHSRPFVFEVLRDKADTRAVLDYKWTLNYFLTRWLDHCLSSDYRFGKPVSAAQECLAT